MRPENEEFKKLFELSGWSQMKAAKRFHCSQPVISRWLRDIDPADKTAVELFKIILSREQPDKVSPVILREEYISKSERELIDLLRELHHEDRKSVESVIRTMISRLPSRKKNESHKKSEASANSSHGRTSHIEPKISPIIDRALAEVAEAHSKSGHSIGKRNA